MEPSGSSKTPTADPMVPVFDDLTPMILPANERMEPLGEIGKLPILGTFELSKQAIERLESGTTTLYMDGILYADNRMRKLMSAPLDSVSRRNVRIEQEIGNGSFGRAYAAYDPEVPSDMVIKIEQSKFDPSPPGDLSVRMGRVSADGPPYHMIDQLNDADRKQYTDALNKFHLEVATHLYVSHMAHRVGLDDEITPRLYGAWFTVTREDPDDVGGRRQDPRASETISRSNVAFTSYILMDRFSTSLDHVLEYQRDAQLHLELMPQMARTLQFLRSIRVVHNDARVPNWGLNYFNSGPRKHQLWLIDWGVATVYESDGELIDTFLRHPARRFIQGVDRFDGNADIRKVIRTMSYEDPVVMTHPALAYPVLHRGTIHEIMSANEAHEPGYLFDVIAHLQPPMAQPIRVNIPPNALFLSDLIPAHLFI